MKPPEDYNSFIEDYILNIITEKFRNNLSMLYYLKIYMKNYTFGEYIILEIKFLYLHQFQWSFLIIENER